MDFYYLNRLNKDNYKYNMLIQMRKTILSNYKLVYIC